MTQEQKQYIIECLEAGTKTRNQLAAELNIRPTSISNFTKKYFKDGTPKKKAIQAIRQYLKDNCDNKTTKEMAAELNLPDNKVGVMLVKLGLSAITPAEKNLYFIYKNHKTSTTFEISEQLHISRARILVIYHENGLTPLEWIKQNEELLSTDLPEPTIEPVGKWSKSLRQAKVNEILNKFLDHLEHQLIEDDYVRPPAQYTQTGSSFTDELYGITTTQRESTLYK